MYDEKKFLILQFNQNFNKFEDKTYEIEWFKDDNNACAIKYVNKQTIYHRSWKDIKILDNPKLIETDKLLVYHLGKQLTDIKTLLQFDEWYKVFYKNGSSKIYNSKNLHIIKDKKDEQQIKNLLGYLKFIATEIKKLDGNDFLLNQLNNLVIQDSSCLYKFLNGTLKKIKDNRAVILPFHSNQSQKLAVKTAMQNELSVIQGPPGTGKTQTILNIVANCVLRGQSVAVVSGNNTATQNVYEKFVKEGYGFLNAFLGNDENVTNFFGNELQDVKLSRSDKSGNQLENALKHCEVIIDKCLTYEIDIARKNQVIEELGVEKEINDAEYLIKEHAVPKIISKKKYTSSKLLELAAFLEVLIPKKITKFFNRARLLFRYGIIKVKQVAEHRNDIVEYLKCKYYDKKIEELTEEKLPLECFLRDNGSYRQISKYESLSYDIFNHYLSDKYSGARFSEFTKENYKNCFAEFVKRYPIIYSTTHALRSCSEKSYLYDCVIIDESSQVDLITATIAFSCAKKVVLVGDEMQITHVVSSKLENRINGAFSLYSLPQCFDYVTNNILKTVKIWSPDVTSTLLCEHYRCDPQIIGFCNKRFYNNQLVVRTEHKSGCGVTLVPHRPHAEKDRANETELESINTEIIPQIESNNIGIIAPYNNQVDLLKKVFTDKNYKIETVHKFQGQECDYIILSAVSDKIRFYDENEKAGDFMDNPNLINVAISRAKKRLFISVSEEILKQEGTILRDLSKYYKLYCSETKVVKSKIYSVFDLMYNDYAPILEEMNKRLKNISEFKSENIIATVIDDVIKEISEICCDYKYGALAFKHNYPLKFVLKTDEITDYEDLKFIGNIHTHCDFVIFNTLDKSIELVVEVDGKFNHSQPEQIARDRRKDRLLQNAGIKLLRLPTTSINCKEKIIEKLREEI